MPSKTIEDFAYQVRDYMRGAEVVASKNKAIHNGTSITPASVTYTEESDGAIDVNGTATGGNSFYYYSQNIPWPNVPMVLSGCPAGGSSSSYRLLCASSDSGATVYAADDGEGVTIPANTGGSSLTLNIYIRVAQGAEVNHKKFYIMFCTEDDWNASHDYMPYFEPLKDSKLDIADQQILGAWNSLPCNGSTNENRSVTYTFNADGTVTGTGTATGGNSSTNYYVGTLPAGDWYFGGGKDQTIKTGIRKTSEGTWIGDSSGQFVPVTIEAGVSYTVFCWVASGTNPNGYVWKPQLAKEPNQPYVPYAMTNKELTDGIKSSFYNATTTNTNLSSFDCAVSKFGKVVSIYFQFKCSTTTLDASESLFTLPEEYRPRRNFAVKTGDIGGNCTKESHQLEFSASTGEIKVFIRETHDASRWISANVTYITS